MKKVTATFFTLFSRVLIVFLGASFLSCQPNKADSSIFVIGQDVQSISDFYSALKNNPDVHPSRYPDGIMVYTAINDLRGLSEPVDHGAGVNHADLLLQKYPDIKVLQIGLYMKHMLKEVVKGAFDENILKLAEWIRKSKKDVYLRIGYEFDNPDNEYDPTDYILAYQYIVDWFRQADVPNVYFVWHSIAWKGKDAPGYDPLKWYPGHSYVDWIGISYFDADQDEVRDQIIEIAEIKQKPVMIAESSPFKRYSVEEKLQWIEKMFAYIEKHDIRFISYINVNWDGLPMFAKEKWGDARLDINKDLFKIWLGGLTSFKRQF